jgi:two-component system response regulator FixJ
MNSNPPGVVAIVDDDPAVLDSLKFLLEVVGYRVATHASAEAFLDGRASWGHADGGRAGWPACLIADHYMPRMTGLDLAERLRDDGVDIPILLITGSPSPAIVSRAAQLGVVRVLEKPPEEHDLLSFVNSYL